MSFNLTFDICKLSHALSPSGSAKIDWTHITATNLQVVLEGSDSRFSNAMLRMDIFQSTTLLERVDVADYIDRSKRFRHEKDRAGASYRIDEMPIFGILKEPLVALRYQYDGKARRLQIKMGSTEGFRQMVDILTKRGMQFSEQRPGTGRPDTSSSRQGTTKHDDRPLTSRDSLALRPNSSVSRPSPFNLPEMEAGSLSRHPPVKSTPSANRAGQLVAPACELTRDESQAPRGVAPSRPSTAQLWRSKPAQSQRPDVYDIQQSADAEVNAGEPSKECTADIEPATPFTPDDFFKFSGAAEPEVDRGGFKVPAARVSSSGEVQSRTSAPSSDPIELRPSTGFSVTSATSLVPETLEHEIPPRRMLPFKVPGDLRPSSAVSIPSAASFTIPDISEHDIPPRRELPFKMPGSGGSGGSGGTSRPGSALPLPPLKRAKPSKERPKTSSPAQKRPSEASASGSRSIRDSEPTKTMRFPVQSSLTFAATKTAPSESDDVAEKTLSMRELIYGGNRIASTRPRINSTMDAPHELESPPDSAEKQRRSQIPQAPRFEAALAVAAVSDDIGGQYGADVVPNNDSHEMNLDQYTSQTPEARQTALDQFMINNLQNPSFTTLCEDVEQCWRRIALGL